MRLISNSIYLRNSVAPCAVKSILNGETSGGSPRKVYRICYTIAAHVRTCSAESSLLEFRSLNRGGSWAIESFYEDFILKNSF